MLEEKCVTQCGANSRGRVVLLWRPGSGRGRGSHGCTSKGAKGRVAYRQRIASLARGVRRLGRAIPSDAPSRRWRLGRLGERTSAIAGRAGLRPFVVCPVFRGWEAGAAASSVCWARAREQNSTCALTSSFIHKRCLLLLSHILAALLYSPDKLSPFNSHQPTLYHSTNTTTTTATMPFTGS